MTPPPVMNAGGSNKPQVTALRTRNVSRGTVRQVFRALERPMRGPLRDEMPHNPQKPFTPGDALDLTGGMIRRTCRKAVSIKAQPITGNKKAKVVKMTAARATMRMAA